MNEYSFIDIKTLSPMSRIYPLMTSVIFFEYTAILQKSSCFTLTAEYAIITKMQKRSHYNIRGSAMAIENDIVLIYLEGSPLAFARIESIDPDIKRGWYHVKFLLLQIPLQVVTWILRDVYINGEIFTMGGKEMRIEKVVCPEDPKLPQDDTIDDTAVGNEGNPSPTKSKNKVITLADLKKK